LEVAYIAEIAIPTPKFDKYLLIVYFVNDTSFGAETNTNGSIQVQVVWL
jgi:hypothetical protein